MFVEFSGAAQSDLDAIKHYIAVEGHTPSPQAAQRTVAKILKAIEVLRTFPRFGRPGRVEETFELDVPSAPYFVVYRFVEDDHIVVTSVIHDRMRYPPEVH